MHLEKVWIFTLNRQLLYNSFSDLFSVYSKHLCKTATQKQKNKGLNDNW